MSTENPFEIEVDVESLLAVPRKRYQYFASKFEEAEAVSLPKRTEWLKTLSENVEPEDYSEIRDAVFECESAEDVAAIYNGLSELLAFVKEQLTGWYYRGAEVPDNVTPPDQLLYMYKMVREDFEGLKNHSAVTWDHLRSVYPLTSRGTRGGGSTLTYDGPKIREAETNQQFKLRTNTTKISMVVDGVKLNCGKGFDALKVTSKDFNTWLATQGVKSLHDALKLGTFKYNDHEVSFTKS